MLCYMQPLRPMVTHYFKNQGAESEFPPFFFSLLWRRRPPFGGAQGDNWKHSYLNPAFTLLDVVNLLEAPDFHNGPAARCEMVSTGQRKSLGVSFYRSTVDVTNGELQ